MAQYKSSFDLFNYNLIGSFRYDKHNRFNDFYTYRLSGDVSYDYPIKPTLLFSYGTGFTVPSFYSLYWKGDSHAVGNPDLAPEESEGYQLGLKLEYSRFSLKVNHSYNEIDNLIQWIEVQLQGGIWKPVNIGSSDIANYEIEANWEILPKLNLFSKIILSETKNKTRTEDGSPSSYYGKELVYIPDQIINIGMDYSYHTNKIKLEYTKTGQQWTTQDNLKKPLPAYELLNATLSKTYNYGKFEHNFNLGLNNLLNNYYEIVIYNPQAPFNWSVGYSIKYKI
jgi:outer membrane cobalamin receptor